MESGWRVEGGGAYPSARLCAQRTEPHTHTRKQHHHTHHHHHHQHTSTYPEGYKAPDEGGGGSGGGDDYQSVPLSKIEDFGVHARQYYALDVAYFKSSLDARLLDLLWNSYWVDTLSASPLIGEF